MEAWWMNFSFRLSIYLCWFHLEYGESVGHRWPCWSYTTSIFHTSIFGFNALTLAKWGHTDSGGIPNGMLRKQGLAGNFIFPYFSHLCMSSSVPCTFALVHFAPKTSRSSRRSQEGTWTPWTHRSFQRAYHHHRLRLLFIARAKIILYFRATLGLL